MEKLKKRILEHLSQRSDYDALSDDILVDELIFNVYLAKKARREIQDSGITFKNRFNDIIKNPAMDIYNGAIRNVNALATKLGISRQERMKLKQAAQEQAD
jgi:P27 family predicted phage terminase small subunit